MSPHSSAVGIPASPESLADGMETVACNLCGQAGTRPFMRRENMDVVQCVGCALVYVSPRLGPQALHAHYNSGESSRTQYYLDVEVADRKSFAEVLEMAERLLPAKGRVLDVGPNIGTCLALARERGWQTCGIEINEGAARYCRETRGLDVIAGILEDHTYPADHFDLVLLGDVIEHVPDPLLVLKRVQKVLKPGGLVMISTPDIAGWAGRVLQVKPKEHIYYFSPATMAAMLEKVSLEVVKVDPLDRYHNLTAMVHSTTFGGLFQLLAPVFRLAHKVLGDVVVKLPLKENLLAVARKPRTAAVS